MLSILPFGGRQPCMVRYDDKDVHVVVRPICNVRTFVIEEAEQVPMLVGMCAMPRWSVQAERRAVHAKKRLAYRANDVTHVVYDDLYDLHRGLSHALDTYETNEIPRLTTALEYCQALHGVVLGLRKDNFEELITRIEGLVDQVVAAIGIEVINAEKVKVLEHIVVTRRGVDSLNRVNSSASCLRMLTAVSNLVQRELQVSTISAVYAVRRQAVRLALAALETQVLIVEDFLNQALENWQTVQLRRRELTADQLRWFARILDTVSVRPFRLTFQHVVREFTTAAQCICSSRMDQAKPLLETARSSMQLRRLRVQLESVHYRVSSAVHDPKLRRQSSEVASVALVALGPIVEELRAIDTLGMVDFSSPRTLSLFGEVSKALGQGDCTAAATSFREALRTL